MLEVYHKEVVKVTQHVHCTSVYRSRLVIQAFGPCLVGHSDDQHINEQWANLIGDGGPDLF